MTFLAQNTRTWYKISDLRNNSPPIHIQPDQSNHTHTNTHLKLVKHSNPIVIFFPLFSMEANQPEYTYEYSLLWKLDIFAIIIIIIHMWTYIFHESMIIIMIIIRMMMMMITFFLIFYSMNTTSLDGWIIIIIIMNNNNNVWPLIRVCFWCFFVIKIKKKSLCVCNDCCVVYVQSVVS